VDLLISAAHAQSAGGPPPGSGMSSFIMLIVFVGMVWFLIIRPQMKRQKEHKAMVDALSKGDEVVTEGGMLGKIIDIGDAFVTVEVANGVQLKIRKHSVGAVMPKGTIKSA
jgi:preprotein translocase subunit YajC